MPPRLLMLMLLLMPPRHDADAFRRAADIYAILMLI